MKSAWYVPLLGLGWLVGVQACGTNNPPETFQLTFQGDATFQVPHATHPISVAVVRTSDGNVVASETGTVSGTTDPAFSFTFPNVLEAGTDYHVNYWIDSNINGGTAGVCDPPDNDHQWSVSVPFFTDLIQTETHDAGTTVPVCTTF